MGTLLSLREALQPPPERMLFQPPALERRSRWLPLLMSVAAHASAFALVGLLTQFASWVTYGSMDRVFPEAEALRVRTPIYFIQPPESPLRDGQTAAARVSALPPSPNARRLELPRTRILAEAPPLLQPGPALRPPPENLPPVLAWTKPRIAQPPRKAFVVPGRQEQQPQIPRLDAPPSLAVANPEFSNGALDPALARTVERPALPVPGAGAQPIRDPVAAPGAGPFILEQLPGEAARIISLNNRLTAYEDVLIPAGAGNGAGSGGAPAGTGDGVGAGAPADRASAGSIGSGGATPGGAATSLPPIRITHSPTGNFDVVITQSVSADDVPGGAALSGNPVYAVYLAVGDSKDWLLQFSVPVVTRKARNPYEIDIGAPAVVTPPYPLSTVIPGVVSQTRRPRNIVLHGYLTADGVFRDMKSPADSSQFIREIETYLRQWRFRAATRDHLAVEVEVLLILPREASQSPDTEIRLRNLPRTAE